MLDPKPDNYCDRCEELGIDTDGTIFRCITCDYDVCQACYDVMRGAHQLSTAFARRTAGKLAGRAYAKRLPNTVMPAKGINIDYTQPLHVSGQRTLSLFVARCVARNSSAVLCLNRPFPAADHIPGCQLEQWVRSTAGGPVRADQQSPSRADAVLRRVKCAGACPLRSGGALCLPSRSNRGRADATCLQVVVINLQESFVDSVDTESTDDWWTKRFLEALNAQAGYMPVSSKSVDGIRTFVFCLPEVMPHVSDVTTHTAEHISATLSELPARALGTKLRVCGSTFAVMNCYVPPAQPGTTKLQQNPHGSRD